MRAGALRAAGWVGGWGLLRNAALADSWVGGSGRTSAAAHPHSRPVPRAPAAPDLLRRAAQGAIHCCQALPQPHAPGGASWAVVGAPAAQPAPAGACMLLSVGALGGLALTPCIQLLDAVSCDHPIPPIFTPSRMHRRRGWATLCWRWSTATTSPWRERCACRPAWRCPFRPGCPPQLRWLGCAGPLR